MTATAEARPPRVFFSHKHDPSMMWVADYFENLLNLGAAGGIGGAHVYRLVKDERLGADLRKQITQGIEWADCVVLFYSRAAKSSSYMSFERKEAVRLHRPIGLVLRLGVRPPPWWGTERYTVLAGIEFPSSESADYVRPRVTDPSRVRYTALEILEFAWGAKNGILNRNMFPDGTK